MAPPGAGALGPLFRITAVTITGYPFAAGSGRTPQNPSSLVVTFQ